MKRIHRWNPHTVDHTLNSTRYVRMAMVYGLLSWSLATVPPTVLAQNNTDDVKSSDYQQKMKVAEQTIKDLKAELKQVVASKSTLESKLARNEKKLGNLTQKIREVEEALASEKKQLALLNEQRTDLMKTLGVQQADLEQLLLGAYRQYRMGHKALSLTLPPSEHAKLPRLMRYQALLAEQQQQQLADLHRQEQEILTLSLALEQHQQTLAQQKQRLVSQKNALIRSQKERSRLVKSLNQQASTNSKRLQKAERERDSLTKVLAAIQKELARNRLKQQMLAFRQQRGKLPWPTQGKVKASFGSRRRPTGQWDGVWIKAKQGAHVKAVHGGRVVFADWLRGFGLLVIVDHGDGFMSLYGHNESINVAIGDAITAQQTIARVGNSGGKDEIGLYFSIRHKGKPQDPARWCS